MVSELIGGEEEGNSMEVDILKVLVGILGKVVGHTKDLDNTTEVLRKDVEWKDTEGWDITTEVEDITLLKGIVKEEGIMDAMGEVVDVSDIITREDVMMIRLWICEEDGDDEVKRTWESPGVTF